MNPEMLYSATIGLDSWCFYKTPAPLPLSLFLLPYQHYIFMWHKCAYYCWSLSCFSVVSLILYMVHQDPTGTSEKMQPGSMDFFSSYWILLMSMWMFFVYGSIGCLSIPGKWMPHLWLSFKFLLFFTVQGEGMSQVCNLQRKKHYAFGLEIQ